MAVPLSQPESGHEDRLITRKEIRKHLGAISPEVRKLLSTTLPVLLRNLDAEIEALAQYHRHAAKPK